MIDTEDKVFLGKERSYGNVVLFYRIFASAVYGGKFLDSDEKCRQYVCPVQYIGGCELSGTLYASGGTDPGDGYMGE